MATSSVTQARRDAIRRKAEIESDYTLGKSRVKQDYRFTKSALDRALRNNIVDTRDQMGAQGLTHSGIREAEEAQHGLDYTNELGLANQGLSRGLENLNRDRIKGMLGISTGMEGALISGTGESLQSILQRALNQARSRMR